MNWLRNRRVPRRYQTISSWSPYSSLPIPLLIMLMNSFKSTAQIGLDPFGLPEEFLWSNYVDAWQQGNFAVTMRNSAFLTASTIFFVLLLAGMAAFALAR